MLKRRDLHWLWFIGLGVFVGLYGVYWKIVHDRAIALMGEQVQAWSDAGYQLEWAEMTTGGFPLSVHAEFAGPQVIAPPSAGGWRWSAESLNVSLRPWMLDQIVLAPRGRHAVSTVEHGLIDAEAEDLVVTLRGGATGLRAAKVRSGYAAAVRRMDGQSVGGFRALDLRLDQDAEDLGLYAMAFEVLEPEWADADGGAPSRAAGRGSLSGVDVLAAQKNLDDRALAAWAAAGGRLDVAESVIEWPDARFGGRAEVAIAPDGEWAAGLDFEAVAPARVFEKLRRIGVVSGREAAQIEQILSRLTGGGAMAVPIPISVRNGQAYVRLAGALEVPIGEVPPAF